MDCICDIAALLNCFTIAFIYSVIACHNYQYLLSFLDSTTFSIEATECIADFVYLLDGDLSFELVPEDYLMVSLIETYPVIVIGRLIAADSKLHELFNELSFPTIFLSIYPEMTSLVVRSK